MATNTTNGMEPGDLASAIAAIVTLARSSGPSNNGLSTLDPRIVSQLLQTQQYQNNRLASVEPVHQAAMAMAARMAPGYARAAMTAPGVAPPISGLPAPTSNGLPGGATASMAALLALAKLYPNLAPLFQTPDPTYGGLIQGNKPPPGGTGFPNVPGIGTSAPQNFGIGSDNYAKIVANNLGGLFNTGGGTGGNYGDQSGNYSFGNSNPKAF